MKSPHEKFPHSGGPEIPKTPKRSEVGPEKTTGTKTYGREDVYAPDVEASIKQLKDMLTDREFLLAALLKSKKDGDHNTTKEIADNLEKTEELIREFSAALAENIDIERYNLLHLNKWLDTKGTKQH